MPVITAKVATRATASAAKQWRALYSLSARYSELLHGLTTLRLLNATSQAKREVDEATKNYGSATMSALRLAFQSSLAAEFTTGVAIGLTAMVVGFQLLAGTVPVAAAFTILLIAAEVYAPLRRTSAEFHNAASGRAAAATLFELMDQSPEPSLDTVVLNAESTTLSFNQTSISLREDRTTLPLTALLETGDVLVVTGVSGSGKSTLLQAIATTLGSNASFMPQRIDLFSATVTENLVLDGRLVVEQDLVAACRVTGFDRVVDELPMGFDTLLGDGGVTLSAGELRKLGLTRALLSDRPVVILDEPTANLDEASLEHLARGLHQAIERRIVIMSAHGQAPLLHPTVLHHVGGSK
jgi:ATP-binding cassette subfamily C protein CydD